MAEPKKAAGFAKKTLQKYADLTKIGDEDIGTQIASLLADLIHLSDKEGYDFESLMNSAQHYYWEDKGSPKR